MIKNKEKLLENLRMHISAIQEKIQEKKALIKTLSSKTLSEVKSLRPDAQMAYMSTKDGMDNRLVELDHLYKAPYFAKCEIITEKDSVSKTYLFAKHEFSEEDIYSWVAPAAAIRFENPGKTSYKLPNGNVKNITIVSKEQYMIVDGNVMFFTAESIDTPRELIYQENFTSRKAGFILPEIVAQMEKAQDQVIRAHHKGPLVISGPAGSGKTTLALHRVAYLTQAPETAPLYSAETIIVFVQDNGTKEYFSHLLPELGINNITITTFSEWAFKILGLKEHIYVNHYDTNEEDQNTFEYDKLQTLHTENTPDFSIDPFRTLQRFYKQHLSINNLKKLTEQKAEYKLDRFDITLLLQAHLKKHGKFETKREYFAPMNGEPRKKIERKLLSYSLVIVDEFQNYLPEQLSLIQHCLNEDTKSIVYVGDMSQQIYLGTIKNLEDIEEVSPDRNIRLGKVYRNTWNILNFIRELGSAVEIPIGIKEGPEVTQRILDNAEQEIEYIKTISAKYTAGTIGILGKEDSYLHAFRKEFENFKNIHVLTMRESQGVEFDLVCIVGIHHDTFTVTHTIDTLPSHIEERKRIERDLLYIALTRAITELHILGKGKL